MLNKKRADNCIVLDWKVQTTASRSLRETCTHVPTFEDWTGENASSVMTGCDGSCRTGVVVVGVGGVVVCGGGGGTYGVNTCQCFINELLDDIETLSSIGTHLAPCQISCPSPYVSLRAHCFSCGAGRNRWLWATRAQPECRVSSAKHRKRYFAARVCLMTC